MTTRPLWRCPSCDREFANRNQSHACSRHTLDEHFAGREPRVRAIFDAFLARIEAIGPVRVLAEKTRIAFQVRMSFAQLTTRRAYANGHLVLARRVDGSPFRKVDTISARNHVHHFRLDSVDDVAAIEPWLAEAYAVGRQEHLTSATGP
ncbi:MAG TPA: DUF5655 domain-containing protein [Thermoanaerobaculia bacterium]|nr:DUF5655 domain-containing protein [Thermoanaerobaculia bacterium]